MTIAAETTAARPARPSRRPAGRAEAPACGVATKTITLALQGGGAHGAFTWGVLDRLLEDDRIGFEAVSARGARRLLAADQRGGRPRAAAAVAARPAARQSRARLLAELRDLRSDDAAAVALSVQSDQPQSAARGARADRRFRRAARDR